jgi:hypothetical protein
VAGQAGNIGRLCGAPLYVLSTVYEMTMSHRISNIEHQAMRSEQGLLHYISTTPHIASTGTVLAAQHHVHVKRKEQQGRRNHSNPNTAPERHIPYNKKQGRQLQDKDVI